MKTTERLSTRCRAGEITDEEDWLIDAAPALLEALKYIIEWNATTWDAEKARDLACAAIAKAEGRA